MSAEAIIDPTNYVALDTFEQFLEDLKAHARQDNNPIISPNQSAESVFLIAAYITVSSGTCRTLTKRNWLVCFAMPTS